MEIIQYGTFKGDLLLDELLASYPQLIATGEDGERHQLVDVGTTTERVKIVFPDALDISEANVRAVLDAHDPTQPSAGEIEMANRTASLKPLHHGNVSSALAAIDTARIAVMDADLAALKGIVDDLLLRQRRVLDALQYLVE
jgi:hypothetical protein